MEVSRAFVEAAADLYTFGVFHSSLRDWLKINYGARCNKETCQSLQQWLIDVF